MKIRHLVLLALAVVIVVLVVPAIMLSTWNNVQQFLYIQQELLKMALKGTVYASCISVLLAANVYVWTLTATKVIQLRRK